MCLTAKNARAATGGKANKDWTATGISINSRTIKKGDLYIALIGNTFNGHNFVVEAMKQGASAAMVAEDYVTPELLNHPLLIVKNTKTGLTDLAKYARSNFKGTIIGITGSVGKTSTKDILLTALSANSKVYASYGNYNNDIGLPLCLAALTNDYEYAIFELGMNAKLEIKPLTKILQPHMAIITEVALVHSAFFKNIEEIAEAKLEIIEGLVGDKILILNQSNNLFPFMKNFAIKNGITNIYSFGEEANNKEVNLINNSKTLTESNASCAVDSFMKQDTLEAKTMLNSVKPNFSLISSTIEINSSNKEASVNQKLTANILNETHNYQLPALAKHQGLLSVLVLGVVKLLNLSLNLAKTALLNYEVRAGRGKLSNINLLNPNNVAINITLIDDSYNASPLSTQKSILMLQNIISKSRKILILGDMLELNQQEEAKEHLKLAEFIKLAAVTTVFTLGELMQQLANDLPENIPSYTFTDYQNLTNKLINYLQSSDIVLVKGSFGSKVHKVVEELTKYNIEKNKE